MQSASINDTLSTRPLAAPPASESLPPVASLGLLLSVCAASWAVLLGLGYGVVRLL